MNLNNQKPAKSMDKSQTLLVFRISLQIFSFLLQQSCLFQLLSSYLLPLTFVRYSKSSTSLRMFLITVLSLLWKNTTSSVSNSLPELRGEVGAEKSRIAMNQLELIQSKITIMQCSVIKYSLFLWIFQKKALSLHQQQKWHYVYRVR